MEKKTVLFIETHFDDLAISSFGTLKKLQDEGYDIHVLTMCKGATFHNKSDLTKRYRDSKNLYEENGFNFQLSSPYFFDTELKIYEINKYIPIISKYINEIEPNIIFIPEKDIHMDHAIIHDTCMVCVRPQNGAKYINTVYEYSALSSSLWNFDNTTENKGYIYFDISLYINSKKEAINTYMHLLKPQNDLRSLSAIITSNNFYGNIVGHEYSERFKLIYERK